MSVTGGTGGTIVLITRNPLERTTDFPASGAFDVSALNTQLDRIIAIQADLMMYKLGHLFCQMKMRLLLQHYH